MFIIWIHAFLCAFFHANPSSLMILVGFGEIDQPKQPSLFMPNKQGTIKRRMVINITVLLRDKQAKKPYWIQTGIDFQPRRWRMEKHSTKDDSTS